MKTVLYASLAVAALLASPALSPALAQEEPAIAAFASARAATGFPTPEAAVDAFKAALAADDLDAVAAILGLDAARVRADEATMASYADIRDGAAALVVVEGEGDRRLIDLGPKLWPLPFPLVRGADGQWSFDTQAGLEEVINRRVGENELEAIATARAYIAAQREYAARDRDGDGVLEFAQTLVSSAGQADGLYWPADDVHGVSPAGEFVDPAALDTAEAEGYFGYRFKVLRRQGDNIAGGAYDFVINGNMIAGYGLVAWPFAYAETGVKTFVVSHHGVVYEADLGPATADIVNYIDAFDPDADWEVTAD